MKHYAIKPEPKPRMTNSDKWKQRPAVLRYRAFCDHARLLKIQVPEAGAHVTFVMPMPKSWSKKQREANRGKAHQQKPDVDNLTKALLDALFGDDSHIWDIRTTKIWGDEGGIRVDNTERQASE